MSKYTTELRYICENLYDGQNHDETDVDDIIAYSATLIFNFDFPVIDESYKMYLAEKIIRHFYTQEIAYETVGLWHLKLKTKMQEIMPYYLQLYKSAQLDFDPFNDVDVSTIINADRTHTGSHTTENVNDYTHKYSRTPQGGLNGLLEDRYLTEASVDNRTTNDSGSETVNVIDNNTESVKGKRSLDSYSKRLMEYRETFLNIDMMVINELEPLFMGIW